MDPFRVHRELVHPIGSLLSISGEPPQFAQIYINIFTIPILLTENELASRIRRSIHSVAIATHIITSQPMLCYISHFLTVSMSFSTIPTYRQNIIVMVEYSIPQEACSVRGLGYLFDESRLYSNRPSTSWTLAPLLLSNSPSNPKTSFHKLIYHLANNCHHCPQILAYYIEHPASDHSSLYLNKAPKHYLIIFLPNRQSTSMISTKLLAKTIYCIVNQWRNL